MPRSVAPLTRKLLAHFAIGKKSTPTLKARCRAVEQNASIFGAGAKPVTLAQAIEAKPTAVPDTPTERLSTVLRAPPAPSP